MKTKRIILVITALALIATIAAAYTIPLSTDFAYDFYNVLINRVFHGPLGYTLAVFLIGFGALKTTVHYDYSSASFSRTIFYICWILLGTMILKIDNIMISLGIVV